jgi:hypothetical protein
MPNETIRLGISMPQQSANISVISANDVKLIKDFLDDHNDVFLCDCEPYMESDTGAWIHNENKCAAYMEDHTEIVLTRLIEWLKQNGPIHVRSW